MAIRMGDFPVRNSAEERKRRHDEALAISCTNYKDSHNEGMRGDFTMRA